ncbi:MAG: glycogen debranching protein, partial [Oscillochloris sp.]|nr:glycogen debranching protein [Oscillochloris sp.]
MCVDFGRDICGNLAAAEMREWLVTNGIGGYASGTVAGLLTRRYHGLLIAALKPPLERTLLLSKIDETAAYDGYSYDLFTNRWADTDPVPHGYWHIERFHVDGTIPVWHFACADALLEKRIWMKPGAHTTYIYYRLCRGTQPLTLTLKALVNYRDYHGDTHANGWRMQIEPIDHGITVTAFPGAVPFYVRADGDRFSPMHEWYYGFALACERERGLAYYEDHLYAASFHKTLNPGSSFTLVASTEDPFAIDGEAALEERLAYEHDVTRSWHGTHLTPELPTPAWVNQLILAADQFIVSRSLPQDPDGKTIIDGYHWFSDWGRDTMISLPGLTLTTGRHEIAAGILRT